MWFKFRVPTDLPVYCTRLAAGARPKVSKKIEKSDADASMVHHPQVQVQVPVLRYSRT